MIQSLWKRRWLVFLVWGLIGLLVLLSLFWASLNWMGKRRWQEVQRRLAQEGDSLDLHAIACEPLPEHRNFCAIPALKDLARVIDGKPESGEPGAKRQRLKEAGLPATDTPRPLILPGITLGRSTDLGAWAAWLRNAESFPETGDPANDLLAALANREPLLAELASGLELPEAQWTPEWKTVKFPKNMAAIQLPHANTQLGIAPLLSLRAAAAARAGDLRKGHESLQICTRLTQASLRDPFIIGTLVAASLNSHVSGITWELCNAGLGTAEDFRKAEQALSTLDFRAGGLRGFRGELAAMTTTLQHFSNVNPWQLLKLLHSPESMPEPRSLGLELFPGWIHVNTAVLADLEFTYLVKPLRDGGLLESVEQSGKLDELIEERKESRQLDSVLATISLAAFSRISQKMIYAQALASQATIACALERYRLEHVAYPESLSGLTLCDGSPLPNDPCSGRLMGYRKTAGKYALWSIGLDGKDDGGTRRLNEKNPEQTKFHTEKYTGDWVWDFTDS